jgi:DNA polymerase-1
MAINAPVQGTAADVMRIAMNQVYAYIKEERLEKEIRMLLQVHDELVFEVKSSKTKAHVKKLVEIMEGVLKGKEDHEVPIAVSVAVGKNWGELKDID